MDRRKFIGRLAASVAAVGLPALVTQAAPAGSEIPAPRVPKFPETTRLLPHEALTDLKGAELWQALAGRQHNLVIADIDHEDTDILAPLAAPATAKGFQRAGVKHYFIELAAKRLPGLKSIRKKYHHHDPDKKQEAKEALHSLFAKRFTGYQEKAEDLAAQYTAVTTNMWEHGIEVHGMDVDPNPIHNPIYDIDPEALIFYHNKRPENRANDMDTLEHFTSDKDKELYLKGMVPGFVDLYFNHCSVAA